MCLHVPAEAGRWGQNFFQVSTLVAHLFESQVQTCSKACTGQGNGVGENCMPCPADSAVSIGKNVPFVRAFHIFMQLQPPQTLLILTLCTGITNASHKKRHTSPSVHIRIGVLQEHLGDKCVCSSCRCMQRLSAIVCTG